MCAYPCTQLSYTTQNCSHNPPEIAVAQTMSKEMGSTLSNVSVKPQQRDRKIIRNNKTGTLIGSHSLPAKRNHQRAPLSTASARKSLTSTECGAPAISQSTFLGNFVPISWLMSCRPSQVLSTQLDRRPSPVYHTECPPLCTTRLAWRVALPRFDCGSWDVYLFFGNAQIWCRCRVCRWSCNWPRVMRSKWTQSCGQRTV